MYFGRLFFIYIDGWSQTQRYLSFTLNDLFIRRSYVVVKLKPHTGLPVFTAGSRKITSQVFWKRLTREYVPTLQDRQKRINEIIRSKGYRFTYWRTCAPRRMAPRVRQKVTGGHSWSKSMRMDENGKQSVHAQHLECMFARAIQREWTRGKNYPCGLLGWASGTAVQRLLCCPSPPPLHIQKCSVHNTQHLYPCDVTCIPYLHLNGYHSRSWYCN